MGAKHLIETLEQDVTEENITQKLQEVAEMLRDPKVRLYAEQVKRVADICEVAAWLIKQKKSFTQE